eukprot:scaffold16229_cov130-Amphora_coffeaeformis.AAC.1
MSGVDHDSTWSQQSMNEVANVLGPKFEAKGGIFVSFILHPMSHTRTHTHTHTHTVSVFLCAKEEKPNAENPEAKTVHWIEFVDRVKQPNYEAQRGINMQKIPPGAATKSDLTAVVVAAAFFVAGIMGVAE